MVSIHIFLSEISLGTIFNTSPIRIAPRAMSSSIKRFLGCAVRKMISSTVSFSSISNWGFILGRNSFRSIGESHGLENSWSRLSLMKLKNTNRLVNRPRFVWGLRSSVPHPWSGCLWSGRRCRPLRCSSFPAYQYPWSAEAPANARLSASKRL